MATSNFIDTATIWLHAGKGGDGAVTFHREDVYKRQGYSLLVCCWCVVEVLLPLNLQWELSSHLVLWGH